MKDYYKGKRKKRERWQEKAKVKGDAVVATTKSENDTCDVLVMSSSHSS